MKSEFPTLCRGEGEGGKTNDFVYHFGHFHSFITQKLCQDHKV